MKSVETYYFGDIAITMDNLTKLEDICDKYRIWLNDPEYRRTTEGELVHDDMIFLEDAIEQLKTNGVYEG